MNLDELRKQARQALELAEKATPGPWKDGDDDDGIWWVKTTEPDHNIFIGDLEDTCPVCHANASFIAASRTLVPDLANKLLEALEELERYHKRDAETLETLRDTLGGQEE